MKLRLTASACCLGVVAGLIGTTGAAVRPAAIFTDGAVLQAHRPVPVWGKADPGEKVVVAYGDVTAETTAKADGSWRVDLPAMDYVRTGRALTVRGSNAVSFADVLVGEVWLGIGQSNMEYPLDLCEEGKVIAKGGVLPTTVRHFHLQKDGDEKPRDLFAVPKGTKWCTYTADNRHANEQSSMLLTFFAKRLIEDLDVPVGVIGAAVGGANLETWMSEEAIADAGMTEEAAKLLKTAEGWHQDDIRRWENRPEREKNRPFPRINFESRPSQVWNAMVPPLAPYAVRGIVWYQGEMNSGWQKYEKQFPSMVRFLRRAFEVTDQPFYIVQLPDYKESHWVRIRDIHRQMSEKLPRSGLVVAIDGHEMELHPRDKRKVADRLVRLALADCYGKDVVARSPAPRAAVRAGDVVRVTFKYAARGLKLTDGAEPRTFELVEKGDQGVPVDAKLVGADTVELSIPAGLRPTRVRYAWSADPDVNLVNSGDLPATPFEIGLDDVGADAVRQVGNSFER